LCNSIIIHIFALITLIIKVMSVDKVMELINNYFRENNIKQWYQSIDNYKKEGLLQVFCNYSDFEIIIDISLKYKQFERLVPLGKKDRFNNPYRFHAITISTLFRLERMKTIQQIFD
jgi:hypothetical protein